MQNTTTNRVSIPNGTIKRLFDDGDLDDFDLFQFQMVRLKEYKNNKAPLAAVLGFNSKWYD